MSERRRNAIEASHFKPAAAGFVFQAPKPWVFGDARHYLVSEAQKADILAIMASPSPPAWKRAAVIGAMILGPVLWVLAVSTLMWAVTDHDEPTAGDAVIMAVFGAGPVLLALFLAAAWSAQAQLARLGPMLARLPPTDERISTGDRRRDMARSVSFRAMLAIILLCGASALVSAFALGMLLAQHTLFSAQSILLVLNLVIPLGVIALYAAMALRKAEDR